MQHSTETLRQTLTRALETAGLAPVHHIDLYKEDAVMVGAPETGVVIITGDLDKPCSDTLGILACRYPVGYHPDDPRQELPENAITIYDTVLGDPRDKDANLARLINAITAGPPAPALRPDPAPLTPAQRVADACELARALGLATGEVTFRHLLEIARSAYARAAVWYGDDAELLADDAHQRFEEEWYAHDDEDQEDHGTEPEARAEFVHRARQQLDRSGRPATEPADVHEAESVRSLYVDILASAMHAHRQLEGDEYAILDAHEPFADLERPLTR